jgi:hypothetical protein
VDEEAEPEPEPPIARSEVTAYLFRAPISSVGAPPRSAAGSSTRCSRSARKVDERLAAERAACEAEKNP